MRAGAICGIPNDIKVLNIQCPRPGPDDVIVKPKRIGLCMTNVKMAMHGYYAIDQRGLPFIEGHEVAGEIVEVGSNVTEYSVGERVVVYVYAACHNCYYCLHGNPTMCEQFILGGIYPGGWAEFVKISRSDDFSRRIFSIADGVSYDDAVMLEPLSCVVHSIERAGLQLREKVVVIGAGFMGLIHTSLLAMYPLSMNVSVDLSKDRLAYAASAGASHCILNENPEHVIQQVYDLTDGRGADVVFEVTGNVRAYELAVKLLGKGGRAIFFGGTPSDEPMQVNPRALHYDMQQLIGCQSAEDTHVTQAMELINSGKITFQQLITHRFTMEDLKEAILFPQDPDNRNSMVKTVIHGFDEGM